MGPNPVQCSSTDTAVAMSCLLHPAVGSSHSGIHKLMLWLHQAVPLVRTKQQFPHDAARCPGVSQGAQQGIVGQPPAKQRAISMRLQTMAQAQCGGKSCSVQKRHAGKIPPIFPDALTANFGLTFGLRACK